MKRAKPITVTPSRAPRATARALRAELVAYEASKKPGESFAAWREETRRGLRLLEEDESPEQSTT